MNRFFSRNVQARREWYNIFKEQKEKKSNQEYYTQQSYHSDIEGVIEFSRHAKTKGVHNH